MRERYLNEIVGKGKSQNHSTTVDFTVPNDKTGEITYYFARRKSGGTADVYLDGLKKATVNYNGSTGSTKSPEFNNGSFSLSYSNLQAGAHTLELKNLDGVVYLDRFVLHSSRSTATPASAPGETTNQSSTAAGGGTSSMTYQPPPNAQSFSIFAESSVNVPFQLVLVNPNGLAVETVNASNGMATITQPVTQGGVYVIKVVNLNLGPLQIHAHHTN
jgi:hypothetical protein